jgi:unsaturated rhamnogalacturonyl hydrolase
MKHLTPIIFLFILCLVCTRFVAAQNPTPSVQMADTAMYRIWVDAEKKQSGIPPKWTYDQGLVLKGIEGVWQATGDGKYFKHLQQGMDRFVNNDGTIQTYKLDEYNIDQVLNGRILLALYKVTGQEKYKKAADLLRQQLKTHPRTSEGGFWHKKIYPYQMWLDGLYMGEPFYAEYSAAFHEDANFTDIANQFIWMEKHVRDAKTGLLYHGWDESKQQRWADKTSGRSPNIWGRAMGWYAMALVDTLDYFPKDHPQRAELLAILNREAKAIADYQEPKSGLWYLIMDKPREKGNYFEASAACMFVYALAKGIRKGYLPESYLKVAKLGYQGIQKQFLEGDEGGQAVLNGTITVAGLGGNPYRDGSYEYYLSEKVLPNDPKGVGTFLLAANEMEMAAKQSIGKGRTVLLDCYFNNETKKDATGRLTTWHYKWEEMANGGFSLWGNIFSSYGVKTESLNEAPTSKNLKGADIYIIVDPDTPEENDNPHFVEAAHSAAIADWVQAGGVLVLMGNDVGNAEFDHFNQLAKRFGIQFNKDSKNRVQGTEFAQGKILPGAQNAIFKTARQLYLKELATLSVTSPAKAVVQNQDGVIMAVARFGKGAVFAVGDPWLYNEYVDGRKLPAEFENFKAAHDLTGWLIRQSALKKR